MTIFRNMSPTPFPMCRPRWYAIGVLRTTMPDTIWEMSPMASRQTRDADTQMFADFMKARMLEVTTRCEGDMPASTATYMSFLGLTQISEGNYIILQGKKKSLLLFVLGVVVQCARNVETWYCTSQKVLLLFLTSWQRVFQTVSCLTQSCCSGLWNKDASNPESEAIVQRYHPMQSQIANRRAATSRHFWGLGSKLPHGLARNGTAAIPKSEGRRCHLLQLWSWRWWRWG